MALLKPIDHAGSGHVCAYWRITGWAVDCEAGKVLATLGGYRDEAARREGLKPLFQLKGDWTATDLGLPDLAIVSVAALYAGFRQNPVFVDAKGDAPVRSRGRRVEETRDAGDLTEPQAA